MVSRAIEERAAVGSDAAFLPRSLRLDRRFSALARWVDNNLQTFGLTEKSPINEHLPAIADINRSGKACDDQKRADRTGHEQPLMSPKVILFVFRPRKTKRMTFGDIN